MKLSVKFEIRQKFLFGPMFAPPRQMALFAGQGLQPPGSVRKSSEYSVVGSHSSQSPASVKASPSTHCRS